MPAPPSQQNRSSAVLDSGEEFGEAQWIEPLLVAHDLSPRSSCSHFSPGATTKPISLHLATTIALTRAQSAAGSLVGDPNRRVSPDLLSIPQILACHSGSPVVTTLNQTRFWYHSPLVPYRSRYPLHLLVQEHGSDASYVRGLELWALEWGAFFEITLDKHHCLAVPGIFHERSPSCSDTPPGLLDMLLRPDAIELRSLCWTVQRPRPTRSTSRYPGSAEVLSEVSS